jgi:hypothetical protein
MLHFLKIVHWQGRKAEFPKIYMLVGHTDYLHMMCKCRKSMQTDLKEVLPLGFFYSGALSRSKLQLAM